MVIKAFAGHNSCPGIVQKKQELQGVMNIWGPQTVSTWKKTGWLDRTFPWFSSPELSITTPAQSPVSLAYVLMISCDIKAVSLQGSTVEALMLPDNSKRAMAKTFPKGQWRTQNPVTQTPVNTPFKVVAYIQGHVTNHLQEKLYSVTGYVSYTSISDVSIFLQLNAPGFAK